MIHDATYEGARRILYDGGALFVPVCIRCGRFVRADETIRFDAAGKPAENATCSRCGRTHMAFEGFY